MGSGSGGGGAGAGLASVMSENNSYLVLNEYSVVTVVPLALVACTDR